MGAKRYGGQALWARGGRQVGLPFWKSRAARDGAALLQAVIEASRRPELFGEGRVPDTLEGRFELLTLHAFLALRRLGGAPDARPLAQAFTDVFFRHLDAGLRESAVGDLAVPKRMRALAGAFYGRLGAYEQALNSGDPDALAAALGRNILGEETAGFARTLADHTLTLAARHSTLNYKDLFAPAAWRV